MSQAQVKSKDRVRTLAEVFTAEREVDAMLALVPAEVSRLESRWLEPSCGTGNFMVRILARKLDTLRGRKLRQETAEFAMIQAVSTICGVDISEENVFEARRRLENVLREWYSSQYNTRLPREGFWEAVRYVLTKTVVLGDTINAPELVVFSEFLVRRPGFVQEREFRLSDLVRRSTDLFGEDAPTPHRVFPVTHYLQLRSPRKRKASA